MIFAKEKNNKGKIGKINFNNKHNKKSLISKDLLSILIANIQTFQKYKNLVQKKSKILKIINKNKQFNIISLNVNNKI